MVRLTDRPDMTIDVYRGRKTTIQQQHYRNEKDFFHSCDENKQIFRGYNLLRCSQFI